jgi:hypothetical protein
MLRRDAPRGAPFSDTTLEVRSSAGRGATRAVRVYDDAVTIACGRDPA